MRTGLMLLLLVALPATAATLELRDQDEIAAARALDQSMDGLVAKVRQCAAAGLAPAAECHCYYPAKLDSARSLYREVIDRHPEWEDRTLLWWEDGRASPSNVQMRGAKIRFATPCS